MSKPIGIVLLPEAERLIVCTHGLIKKTNKTPKQDIRKAEMIKDKYFKGLI